MFTLIYSNAQISGLRAKCIAPNRNKLSRRSVVRGAYNRYRCLPNKERKGGDDAATAGTSRQNGLSLSAGTHLYDAALAPSNTNLSRLYPAMKCALILLSEITWKAARRPLFMHLFGIRFFLKRLHSRVRDASDSTVWHSVFTQRTFRT